MNKKALFSFLNLFSLAGLAQQQDTSAMFPLPEVTIKTWQHTDIKHLPEEHNNFLVAGKKNEVVVLESTEANISLKTGRQLFAKVPGVFVYDMDGSGNQINIAARGLDPHRSWEFNVRQNGIIINSDMYGYPASHFSAPVESYETIELIRGTAALQYGAQFGGMINYVVKKPDTAKPFNFESINTIGSFGLLSSYNAISGKHRRLSYQAYYYRRHLGGYRDNSRSEGEAQFIQLSYEFSKKLNLRAELGRSKYLHQIPGPLNDSMFAANARLSTRSRNFYSPDIYVPAITLDLQLTERTKVTCITSGVFGVRNSVILDAFANVPDTVSRLTGAFRNRQVDIDDFNSRTAEVRGVHEHRLGKLALGVTYMNNNLHRRQMGKGTTGSDYDLTVSAQGFGRDLHFKTQNIAMYAEHAFKLSQKWIISPGLRIENGRSEMTGVITYYTTHPLPTTISHNFLLGGITSQWTPNKRTTVYGGISEAYRPVIFKDVVPASTYEQIDKDLQDAKGYNAEAGIRGNVGRRLKYDICAFNVLYQNRLGTLVLHDENGQPYIFRTNIGDSRTAGIELFGQYTFSLARDVSVGIFSSTSYMQARYTKGKISYGAVNRSIKGNKVEAAPDWISRSGVELARKGLSCTILYSYTSGSFSDALNTVIPPASGARGWTPAYGVWDINMSLRTHTPFSLRAGVSNIFDKKYFTKRPAFYPGPGIWPSDGRNAYVTVGFKL